MKSTIFSSHCQRWFASALLNEQFLLPTFMTILFPCYDQQENKLPVCAGNTICAYLQANARGINTQPLCSCAGPSRCPLIWDNEDGHSITQGSDQYKVFNGFLFIALLLVSTGQNESAFTFFLFFHNTHLWFATHVVSFVVTATHPAQCPCKEPRTSVGWYSQKICRISGLDWQTCTKFVRLLRDFCPRLLIVVFSWKDVVNLKTINNPHKLNTQFRKGLIHPGKLKASENH